MADQDATATLGVEARGYRRGTTAADGWDQYVVPVRDRITMFAGRTATFATQGAAATTQNLFALHNATGSDRIVCVNRITVDCLWLQAAGVAPTIQSPIIRVRRFTALPTAGTALTKTGLDTTMTSSASVTAWGTTASDNGALTTLAVTAGGILSQKHTPRLLVVGTSATTLYEVSDPIPFFHGEPDITLRALEGLVVTLEGAAATGNPATLRWLVECDWEEYTRP